MRVKFGGLGLDPPPLPKVGAGIPTSALGSFTTEVVKAVRSRTRSTQCVDARSRQQIVDIAAISLMSFPDPRTSI
jgi:hypothetical protein